MPISIEALALRSPKANSPTDVTAELLVVATRTAVDVVTRGLTAPAGSPAD